MKTAVLIGLSRHRIGVDGAGVTTLVAFHGCPLNCKYCLNPQALSPKGVWKRYTPDELFRVVSKDDLYFRAGNLCRSCREIGESLDCGHQRYESRDIQGVHRS